MGERLRRLRVDRGLSLQEVERASEGHWKAAVVGSYERGDRNISATRLLELATFYGVSPAQLLPGGPTPRETARDGLVLDLQGVERLGPGYEAVRRYVDAIRLQRGDFNRNVLSIRGEDLRTLAVVQDVSTDQLLQEFRRHGALATVDGRPAPSDADR